MSIYHQHILVFKHLLTVKSNRKQVENTINHVENTILQTKFNCVKMQSYKLLV